MDDFLADNPSSDRTPEPTIRPSWRDLWDSAAQQRRPASQTEPGLFPFDVLNNNNNTDVRGEQYDQQPEQRPEPTIQTLPDRSQIAYDTGRVVATTAGDGSKIRQFGYNNPQDPYQLTSVLIDSTRELILKPGTVDKWDIIQDGKPAGTWTGQLTMSGEGIYTVADRSRNKTTMYGPDTKEIQTINEYRPGLLPSDLEQAQTQPQYEPGQEVAQPWVDNRTVPSGIPGNIRIPGGLNIVIGGDTRPHIPHHNRPHYDTPYAPHNPHRYDQTHPTSPYRQPSCEPRTQPYPYNDPRYNDPRYNQPRYNDPRYNDSRYNDPRYNDPRYNDPRYSQPFDTRYRPSDRHYPQQWNNPGGRTNDPLQLIVPFAIDALRRR